MRQALFRAARAEMVAHEYVMLLSWSQAYTLGAKQISYDCGLAYGWGKCLTSSAPSRQPSWTVQRPWE